MHLGTMQSQTRMVLRGWGGGDIKETDQIKRCVCVGGGGGGERERERKERGKNTPITKP